MRNNYSCADAGPRMAVPRSLRWASCGAISVSFISALLIRLFSAECEPQNMADLDKAQMSICHLFDICTVYVLEETCRWFFLGHCG